MDADRMSRSLARIAHEILERNRGAANLALIGIRARGVPLAARIARELKSISGSEVPTGALDISTGVIVLEALSRVLPDHTYVTEMHLAGNKLQIAGITRDAPSLIPLIEQSQHFRRATFYAPTTRAPSDPGERFHIEARVEPKNATGNP